jgi:2,3-bisphosphoglycerate-independent phosphoglycerate mutase
MTAHTTNPVPLLLVAPDNSGWRHAQLRAGGRLADVAPTLLALLALDKPDEMTGEALVEGGKP